MRPRLVLAALLASLVGLALAAPAYATFPGANGKIAFVATTSPCCNADIFVVNPDGTGVTDLTNTTSTSNRNPSWSPDGTKIAFERQTNVSGDDAEIYVMNANGTGLTQLTNNTVPDLYPAWSPNGTTIAFVRGPNSTIYTINSDGSGEAVLANPATFGGNSAESLDWNSLGNRIAFKGGSGHIWVMAADGSSGGQITHDPPTSCCDYAAFDPSWSPSGAKIAFTQWYLTGDVSTGDIEVMNADGSSRQKVTPNDGWDEESPVWSPDGSRIVYTDELCGYCLVFINPDGTNRSPTSVLGGSPAWQPVARVAYERPQSATTLSTSLVPLFKQCGTSGSPANASHSPPLAVGSCSPPSPSSAVARVGPQMLGSAALTVTSGDTDPTNGDQADVALATSLTDVQTTAGADYDPNTSGADLTQVTRLRLTDRANGYGGASGTAADVDFPVPIDCAATTDPSVGSICAVNTTADTVLPGFAQEQRRAVIQVFRVRVYDAGLNGIRENGTGDDAIFAHQGVFVP